MNKLKKKKCNLRIDFKPLWCIVGLAKHNLSSSGFVLFASDQINTFFYPSDNINLCVDFSALLIIGG